MRKQELNFPPWVVLIQTSLAGSYLELSPRHLSPAYNRCRRSLELCPPL